MGALIWEAQQPSDGFSAAKRLRVGPHGLLRDVDAEISWDKLANLMEAAIEGRMQRLKVTDESTTSRTCGLLVNPLVLVPSEQRRRLAMEHPVAGSVGRQPPSSTSLGIAVVTVDRRAPIRRAMLKWVSGMERHLVGAPAGTATPSLPDAPRTSWSGHRHTARTAGGQRRPWSAPAW